MVEASGMAPRSGRTPCPTCPTTSSAPRQSGSPPRCDLRRTRTRPDVYELGASPTLPHQWSLRAGRGLALARDRLLNYAR
jgi:hypothetical protein